MNKKAFVYTTAALLAAVPLSHAADKSWNSANNGNHTSSNSWSPIGVPGATDDIVTPTQYGDLRVNAPGGTWTVNNITLNLNVVDPGPPAGTFGWNIASVITLTGTNTLKLNGNYFKAGAGTMNFKNGNATSFLNLEVAGTFGMDQGVSTLGTQGVLLNAFTITGLTSISNGSSLRVQTLNGQFNGGIELLGTGTQRTRVSAVNQTGNSNANGATGFSTAFLRSSHTSSQVLGNDQTATTGVTGTATITINGNQVGAETFAGSVRDQIGGVANATNAQTLKIVKTGTGTQVFSGANAYSGGTSVQNGVLRAASDTALGTGNVDMEGTGAVLEYANGVNVANNIFFRNTGDAKTLRLLSSATSATHSGNIILLDVNAGDSIINVGTGGTLTSTGNIYSNSTATQGFTKSGAGTLLMNGTDTVANRLLGNATVTGGRLRVNGTYANATGSIIASSGATVDGTGRFAGAITINSGATLAPGNSIESLVGGALTINGGTYAFELNTTLETADLYASTGSLTLTSTPLLTLTDLGSNATLANDTKFTMISYNGTWDNGIFQGYADDSIFTLGANSFRINYNDTTGGSNFAADQTGAAAYLTLTVVPEPSTAALLGGVGFALLLIRRRRTYAAR